MPLAVEDVLMEDYGRRAVGPIFPYSLLTLALMVSLAVITVTSLSVRRTSQQLDEARGTYDAALNLHTSILLYDEILTMSAWMTATTGDEAWAYRYDEFEPRLGRALEALVALAPEDSHHVERTREANDELVRRERLALAAVRSGDREGAAGYLAGEDYRQLKLAYKDSIIAFGDAIAWRFEEIMADQQRDLARMQRLLLLVALFIAGSWSYVIRALLRWRRALQTGYDELYQSQLKLQRALSTAELGTFSIEPERQQLVTSPRARVLFGLSQEDDSIEAFLEHIHEPARSQLRETLARAVLDDLKPPQVVDYAAMNRCLRLSWAWSQASDASSLSGLVRDITAERLIEDQLREDNDRLSREVDRQSELAREHREKIARLMAELLRAEQQERSRIQHLIHDELQQILVSIRMQLAMVRDRCDEGVATLDADRIAGVIAQLDESLECTRDLAVRLAPPMLESQGLGAGLSHLCEEMNRRYGLHVDLHTSGALPEIGLEVMQLVYQVVRELLFNVVKHAGVSHARVEIELDAGQQLRVLVEDDGAGFDVTQLRWEDTGRGDNVTGPGPRSLGLRGMRTRAATIDGILTVDSAPARGCRIVLSVPDAVLRDRQVRTAPQELAMERGPE
jgi:signal transduction histidine kinase